MAVISEIIGTAGGSVGPAAARTADPGYPRVLMDEHDDEQFEGWVIEAIDALPTVFRDQLGSVAITIEAWPSQAQLESTGAPGLFGLYHGVPRSAIGADYAAVPSRITIFRGPIEQWYRER